MFQKQSDRSYCHFHLACAGCNAIFESRQKARYFSTCAREHLSSDKGASYVFKHLQNSEHCRIFCSADCFPVLYHASSSFQEVYFSCCYGSHSSCYRFQYFCHLSAALRWICRKKVTNFENWLKCLCGCFCGKRMWEQNTEALSLSHIYKLSLAYCLTLKYNKISQWS